jgi:hypothetical protein
MRLTRKMLNKILIDWRMQIPAELKNQLLEDYGNLVEDKEGHFFEYSEQDICEHLRKTLRPYEKDTLNLNRVPFERLNCIK